MNSDIRVVVADDHPIVREGLTALLNSVDGLEVVGVAATGHEAIRKVMETRPNVAVLDLQMPGLDGYEATRQIARTAPKVAVLVLTMFEDDDAMFAAMRAGANGYLVKGAQQDEIIRAIHAVAAGEAIFGSSVAKRVLGLLGSAPRAVEEPFPELTHRERQILDLLAAGLTNPAIARQLGLTAKTVANNVSTILAKLQIADRAQAALRARDAGLGHD